MTLKTDINFRITGPCLSLLLRDCECSNNDQVGFLIGENTSIKTQTVSDTEMEEEKIETTISINGTFPVGLPYVFCSPLGKIDENALTEVLGSLEKDVVGWYSFRRNCNHSLSLLQTLLHIQLQHAFGTHNPPQNLMFCIITKAENDDYAQNSFRFTFFVMNRRRLQPVSVLETNSGEPEENVYKRTVANSNSFKYLQQVISSVNGVNNSKMAMTTFHSEVNKHVSILQKKVSELQEEVDSREYQRPERKEVCSPPPSTSAQRDLSAEY